MNPWDLYPDAPVARREPNLYDVYRMPTLPARENPPDGRPGDPGPPVSPFSLDHEASSRGPTGAIDQPTRDLRAHEILGGKPPVVTVAQEPGSSGRTFVPKGNHTLEAARDLGVPVKPAPVKEFGSNRPAPPAVAVGWSMKEHLAPDKGVAVDPNEMGDRPFRPGTPPPQGAVTDRERAAIRARDDQRPAPNLPKRSTMMSLEDENGNRMLVSVKDRMLTQWDRGRARALGTVGQMEDAGWRLTPARPEEITQHTTLQRSRRP